MRTGNTVALQTGTGSIGQSIENLVESFISFLPNLVGALLILLIGWIIGAVLGSLVKRLTDRSGVDSAVSKTPIGKMLGGTQNAVSKSLGAVAKWFVIALAILAAADALSIPLLSQWISTALAYLPAFIAGLLVIVFGFVVADFIGDMITQTEAATRTSYTEAFATGTRLFLYFTVIVIGLDTMGIDVSILFILARAVAWGLGAALALGAGLAFGLGGRDYVSHNIDRWMGNAKRTASKSKKSQQTSAHDD